MRMIVIAAVLLAASPTLGDTVCPAAVATAINKAFPKATINRCRAEKEHGHDQFEVKLTRADGTKAEVDVAPDGKILQVEEGISVEKLPAAVTKAFAAKYPKGKIDRAEKQTPSTGSPTFELAFQENGRKKEATFGEDGTFIEEE
jgi:hypothetical protein